MLHKLPKSVEIKILGMITTTIASVFKYILARVLEEKSFEEIADKLGLKYKGVAAIYYRGFAKLRNILEGEL